MFTGIIEDLGKVVDIQKDNNNVHFYIESKISKEAHIDQSIAHNGVCLTVVALDENVYKVTAIDETLKKTNLGDLTIGDFVNLERSLLPDRRMDGHFVQGHVDMTTTCTEVIEAGGSWYFYFKLPREQKELVVSKGSICINGTSLTCILEDDRPDEFAVAIIPFTYEHTVFKFIQKSTVVNLEFDILGKYISRYLSLRGQ